MGKSSERIPFFGLRWEAKRHTAFQLAEGCFESDANAQF